MLRVAVGLVGAVMVALPAGAAPEAVPPQAAFVLLRDGRLVKVGIPRGPIAVRRIARIRPLSQSGPLLALDERRRLLYALLQNSVAVLDTRTVTVRRRFALPAGLRHRGLALGVSGRLYVAGNRPVRVVDPSSGLAVEDAVVTILDTRTGAIVSRRLAREAAGRSWFVWWIAVSPDERRIALAYHGGCGGDAGVDLCTTGADVLGLTDSDGLVPCSPSHPDEPQAGCSAVVHGAVAAYREGFVAATGTSTLVELDRDGRVVRELDSRLARNHVMTLALDPDAGTVYVTGSCPYAPGLNRVTLATGRVDVLAPASGRRAICGERTAIGPGPLLALATRPFPLVGGADALVVVDGRSGRRLRTFRLGHNPLEVVVGAR
jgi:hypothetical protein